MAARLLGGAVRSPCSEACEATHNPTIQAARKLAISPTDVSCRKLESLKDIFVRQAMGRG